MAPTGAVEVRVRRLSTLNESTTEQQEDTCCFQKFGANPKGQGISKETAVVEEADKTPQTLDELMEAAMEATVAMETDAKVVERHIDNCEDCRDH